MEGIALIPFFCCPLNTGTSYHLPCAEAQAGKYSKTF